MKRLEKGLIALGTVDTLGVNGAILSYPIQQRFAPKYYDFQVTKSYLSPN